MWRPGQTGEQVTHYNHEWQPEVTRAVYALQRDRLLWTQKALIGSHPDT